MKHTGLILVFILFPEMQSKGADIVIHSVHKTLPAFTQTALLHMNGKSGKPGKSETISAYVTE